MSVSEIAAARPGEPAPAQPGVESESRVVAVTAVKHGTAKRGLAAGVARALASIADARVCVVDADTDTREVGWRMGVAGPTVTEVEDARLSDGECELRDRIARDEAYGCWVIPLASERHPTEVKALATLLPALRESFDYIVIDAPVAFATHARRLDETISEVDELLVATDARSTGLNTLTRYLNRVTRGRITGELPAELQVRVVPTGEDRGDQIANWLNDSLRAVPVTEVVPSLWGRHATAGEGEADAVPENLLSVVRDLATAP
jgi:MinD-like ATPase involved in chromosome partitioning or flagellar assembly